MISLQYIKHLWSVFSWRLLLHHGDGLLLQAGTLKAQSLGQHLPPPASLDYKPLGQLQVRAGLSEVLELDLLGSLLLGDS